MFGVVLVFLLLFSRKYTIVWRRFYETRLEENFWITTHSRLEKHQSYLFFDARKLFLLQV